MDYLKVYGVAGDPVTSYAPGLEVSGRVLLYSSTQKLSPLPNLLEFDLTTAIRKAKLELDVPEGFRIDFTAYLPGEGALPLKNAELVIQTIPEPSAHFALLSAVGILLSGRRWMILRR